MLSLFLLELSCQHSWSCQCWYNHHVMPSCLTLHSMRKRETFLEPWHQSPAQIILQGREQEPEQKLAQEGRGWGYEQDSFLIFCVEDDSSTLWNITGWQTSSLLEGCSDCTTMKKLDPHVEPRFPQTQVTAKVCPSMVSGPALQHQHHLGNADSQAPYNWPNL